MIRVTAAVVANDGADVFRHGVQVADQIFDRFGFQLGLPSMALFRLVM